MVPIGVGRSCGEGSLKGAKREGFEGGARANLHRTFIEPSTDLRRVDRGGRIWGGCAFFGGGNDLLRVETFYGAAVLWMERVRMPIADTGWKRLVEQGGQRERGGSGDWGLGLFWCWGAINCVQWR